MAKPEVTQLDWSTARRFAETMTPTECRFAAKRLRDSELIEELQNVHLEITTPREDVAGLLEYVAELKEQTTASLEALEYCKRVLAAGDISERDIQAVYGKAEAAIRRAKGG
jgi:hypothetical protein